MFKIKKIHKTCSFYVSVWHLIAVLTPFIFSKIIKKEEVYFVSNKVFKKDLQDFLAKVNLNEEDKTNLLKIKWVQAIGAIENIEEKTIIVIGENNYIQNINEEIREKVKKKVTVVNCFNIEQNANNAKEILRKHDNVLSTGGIVKGEEKTKDVANG